MGPRVLTTALLVMLFLGCTRHTNNSDSPLSPTPVREAISDPAADKAKAPAIPISDIGTKVAVPAEAVLLPTSEVHTKVWVTHRPHSCIAGRFDGPDKVNWDNPCLQVACPSQFDNLPEYTGWAENDVPEDTAIVPLGMEARGKPASALLVAPPVCVTQQHTGFWTLASCPTQYPVYNHMRIRCKVPAPNLHHR